MHETNRIQVSPVQKQLADFVTKTRFESIPPEFVTRLKWSLVDSLGCGLHGSGTPWGRIVAKFARSQGEGSCRIWGSPQQTSTVATAAVLANATMIQSFEMDDVHYGTRSHPGSVTMPVAMAITETAKGISGRKFLEAVAVGYEVLVRVGACQGISSFNRGWHPTGTAGAFGAAATASRLLGLSSEECIHALGIAGTMPAGLMSAQYGAMVKRLFVGHAAWSGLVAAQLAKDGFTGIENIFDVEYGGYPKAVSDEISIAPLTQNLGERFEAATIGYKLFACVGTNHTTLEAVSQMMREYKFTWQEVSEVNVLTSEYQVLHSGWNYKPSTVMAAQMNMKYCTAMLLMHGKLFVDEFSEKYLADSDVLALVNRVRVAAKADQDHKDRESAVEIRLTDGRRLQASCSAAKGHPLNPPSWKDIEDKFLVLASEVIPAHRCHQIIEAVANFESIEDLSEFTSLMTPSL